MKPEDKVVEEVVAYFSEPKFSQFSIIKECEIQMGTDNRAADIVLRDVDGKFVVIAECKSPSGANYGIPQLKSYLSATDTPFGIFAPRIERDSWVFYENLRHNRFQQIDLSEFEKGVLLKEEDEMAENIVPTGTSSKTEYSNVPIGTSNPGCIIILVDQSWSMNEDWQTGTKAEQASIIVNRAIYNLALKCQLGTEIRQRCYVCVISYGERVDCVVEDMIADVYASPIERRKVKKSIPDGAGGIVDVETELPIWLPPRSSGGTPMHEAFERAAGIIERWISDWPDSFPPVVINVTDGEPTHSDLTGDAARTIMDFKTTDGNALVYNIHIADDGFEMVFPNNNAQFADNPPACFLFSISSALPEPLFPRAMEHNFTPQPNARCFGYNASEVLTTRIIEFGSPGTDDLAARVSG